MNEKEIVEITRYYEGMSDEQLIAKLSEGKENFKEGVYEIILDEVNRRKLLNPNFGKPIPTSDESKVEKETQKKGFFKPNEIQHGGGWLIFFGVITIIFSLFSPVIEVTIINILAGFILFVLGIGAWRKNIPCIYLGALLWLIGFMLATLQVFESIGTKHTISTFRIIVQGWVLWELIKSTPKYRRFIEGAKKK